MIKYLCYQEQIYFIKIYIDVFIKKQQTMKNILFFQTFFFICTIFYVSGQQINGIIYYRNSCGKMAENVQVNAFGCNSTYSDTNGMFSLKCPAEHPGRA